MPDHIELIKGTIVRSGGQEWEIFAPFDLEQIVAINTLTKERQLIAIRSIQFPPSEEPILADRSLINIPEKQWEKGRKRLELVNELQNTPNRSREDAERIAANYGVHPSTLYKWAKKFRKTGTLDSLVSEPRQRNDRLPDAVEDIIQKYIKTKYLTSQKNSINTVWKYINKECHALGLRTPHTNTLAKRIRKLEPKAVALVREGVDAASRFDPTPGTSPDKAWPGNTYQIDHTKLDITIVDSVHRLPIGRAWITVAIDTNSRTVPGFCVSIEAPSTESVSETVRLCLIPKDEWLESRNLQWKWPIWGKPKEFHADNAAEFRSEALERALNNKVIGLEWRPGGKKYYGAYIERYLGSLSTRLHEVPGTTFSNPTQRAEYDSEGLACMTIDEVEIWLAHVILGEYHNKPHSGLNGKSPLQAHEEGIIGTSGRGGKGLPSIWTNMRQLYLDFLPREERVVQPTGIQWQTIHYWDDRLRPFIGLKDSSGKAIKMEFAYDRRRLSPIYLYSEATKEYLEIPFADLTQPNTSLWQFKATKKYLASQNKPTDQASVFKAIELADQVIEGAMERTKSVRREHERARQREKKLKSEPQPLSSSKSDSTHPISSPSGATATEPPNSEMPWDDIPDYSAES